MRYQHDCTNCQPLGEFGKYDLYVCVQKFDAIVISRYSDGGPDYASQGLRDVPEPRTPALAEAKKRAEEMGLIPKPKPKHERGWWGLSFTGVGELTEADREHIAAMILEGFEAGEIIHEEEGEE